MLYFFPDSHDYVDPSFDFQTETRSPNRIRQRDDRYAHELLTPSPYDGLLVSRSIFESEKGGKYSQAQRHRFRREGVHQFLRTRDREGVPLLTMGDCGAFSYADEPVPPVTVEDVFAFYAEGGFDFGISVDHVIRGYQPLLDETGDIPGQFQSRQELTLELNEAFLKLHRSHRPRFKPLGVAQGWSPRSYVYAVSELEKIGYSYIALGGLANLRTLDITAILEAIKTKRRPQTKFHLLGVSRLDCPQTFSAYGVASFDSTYPLKTAFKDENQNYLTQTGAYKAIRIPQTEGNAEVLREVQRGRYTLGELRAAEFEAIQAMYFYDQGRFKLETALRAITHYEGYFRKGVDSNNDDYRRTLNDAPWRSCQCEICQAIGYHVVIFRGAERNKRRAIHNLAIFKLRMKSRGF